MPEGYEPQPTECALNSKFKTIVINKELTIAGNTSYYWEYFTYDHPTGYNVASVCYFCNSIEQFQPFLSSITNGSIGMMIKNDYGSSLTRTMTLIVLLYK